MFVLEGDIYEAYAINDPVSHADPGCKYNVSVDFLVEHTVKGD